MNKAQIILMKTLKATLWVALSFVLIFVILAALIQVPAIQNKIIKTATTFISNKTHTRVEIKNVSISFPKSVALEGLFLEDLNKDTLVYAKMAKINIAFADILFNQINVNSVTLEGLNLNLHNTETDSLFNYNFLLAAFSDTASAPIDSPKTPSAWTTSFNHISLKNIKIRYDDNYSGMNAQLSLASLQLKIESMDIENLVFKMDDLIVENLHANLLIKESLNPKGEKSESKMPLISANNIQLNNSILTYNDSIIRQSAVLDIQQLKLKTTSLNLENSQVSLDKIYLADSKISYKTVESKTDSDSTEQSTINSEDSWKVKIKAIELKNNSLAYDVQNTPEIKEAFDVNHLYFKHFMFDAADIEYSSAQTKATIKKFSAMDKNKFIFTGFSTVFSMDNKSITAKNLKASTTSSWIKADLNMQYKSLKTINKDLANLILNIDVKDLSIKNSDILYFNPALVKQEFFNNKKNTTTFTGQITGAVKNIKGRNLLITTGQKTKLKTDFNITGLPNSETATYHFPNLHAISGKKDLQMIAGSSLPQNLEIPENIDIKLIFKGKIKDFRSTIDLNSSFGSGHLVANIDKDENFNANINIPSFDLGSLMKDKAMYGPVSLVAEVNGHGVDPETIKANIKATVSQIYLNKYNYQNLTVDGKVNGKELSGKLNLNDKNAVLDFDGLVNLTPKHEHYKLKINVQGMDFQKLNFSDKDLRLSFSATTDLKGESVNNLNGKMGIGNMIIVHGTKKYMLDSLLVATINQPQQSSMNISSALVDLKYSGTLSPASLPTVLTQFANTYFPVAKAVSTKPTTDSTNFKFEVQLRNHPILSEVFFPELKEFEPGIITGSFNNSEHKLLINGEIFKIVYGSTEINNLNLDINSDSTALNYKFSSSGISNSQINLVNFMINGKMADNELTANISSVDNLFKKLLISTVITKNNANYKLVFNPEKFYLNNTSWNIATDNYVEFGKQGFLIHNLLLNNATEKINISSVNNRFNDDIKIAINNFRLEDISQIVEKDSSLLKGNVDGNILLKRVNNSYGIIADANISDLVFRNIPIGNLAMKADNPTTEKFNIDLKLSGIGNNITASGYFSPNGDNNSLNINTNIHSLSMKTVQAFSMGQLTDASGSMSGNFDIGGSTAIPEVSGQLVFNNAFINPSFLNNKLELKHETIQLKPDGIYFDSFTLLDANKHKAVIDGKIKMKQFSDFIFGLQVTANDFLLFNTTSTKENSEFYGRMIVDSKINITGPMSLPVINAQLKMKKGSNFTFVVPEDELTTDKGENVVEFVDSIKQNSILYRTENKVQQKQGFKGFDLTSIIEVDKDATLKLLMDPTSTDSLVVKGEAALSFSMDKSGKKSLTGAYNLNEGSYLISLESVIKKKFNIVPGSTIIWNGDPMDADISINATYSVRTTPIDLVANQLVGASDADKAGYKQPYPFEVILKLRGAILQPIISFEIQLAPEDKGIMGGAVNQKLVLLNDDLSALNKQVFALLVLGRFIQENPLQSESGSTESLVRSTVGSFLSTQLNRLSSNVLSGVEMNFDIQSYNDFQSGEAQGRTQVELGVKKQLFNDRLSVEIGGKVDVEGAAAKQNSVSDIASDVTVEYKIVKDGSYRLKAFRHNQYEGAIEGQLVETGAGILFVKDFNRWGKKKK